MAKEESKQVYLYVASRFLERGGYYGLRAILVLYMIDSNLNLPREKAISIFGYVSTFLLFSEIIGACLGDFFSGNKNASLFGGLTFMLGTFVLCLETMWALYFGMGLVILGSGLFGPNLFSIFGKTISKNNKILDGRMTLYYIAANIGTAFGILIVAYLSEKFFGYKFGFILSGLAVLAATLLLYKTKSFSITYTPSKARGIFSNNYLNLLFILFVGGLFWMLNGIGNFDATTKVFDIYWEYSEIVPTSFSNAFQSYFVILFGVIGVFVWYNSFVQRFVKLSFGFIFMALSFVVLLFLPEVVSQGSIVLLVVSFLFYGAGEILMAPTIDSLLIKYTNSKYLALVYSLRYLPGRLFFFLNAMILPYIDGHNNLGIKIAFISLLLIGGLLYTLRHHFYDDSPADEEIDEIGKEEL